MRGRECLEPLTEGRPWRNRSSGCSIEIGEERTR
jgi:hypothetical protein